MKTTRNILIAILTISLISCYSSQLSGQITTTKEGLKKYYLYDGDKLSNKQLAVILTENPASVDKYKTSKALGIAGLSSIAVGTGFMGAGLYYSIKSAQASNENDLVATTDYSNKSGNNLLIGAGFYVLSVPFMILSNSNLKKSISLFNSSSSTSSLNKFDLYVGITDEGLGVGLTF